MKNSGILRESTMCCEFLRQTGILQMAIFIRGGRD